MTVAHRSKRCAGLTCGCFVLLQAGDVIGVALNDAKVGERLRLGRWCPIHGLAEVCALADNTCGGVLCPDRPEYRRHL